jgi:hypothetical protein
VFVSTKGTYESCEQLFYCEVGVDHLRVACDKEDEGSSAVTALRQYLTETTKTIRGHPSAVVDFLLHRHYDQNFRDCCDESKRGDLVSSHSQLPTGGQSMQCNAMTKKQDHGFPRVKKLEVEGDM